MKRLNRFAILLTALATFGGRSAALRAGDLPPEINTILQD